MNLNEVAEATLAADLVRRVSAVVTGPCWVVGGAVRDVAIGRPVSDLDLAVEGSPEPVAKAIAGALDGFAFELSAEFPTWRARDREGSWQVDVATLREDGILGDLALRDFTAGALAVDLATGEGLDPHHGLADIERGSVRAVGPRSFSDDPLRLMRAARFVSQFGWSIEPDTVALGRETAPRATEPAGERTLAELCRLVSEADPVGGVAAMDQLGLLDTVLPEIGGLRGVVQGPNHHLDVYGHTVEVLEGVLRMEQDLERYVGASAPGVRDLLAEPLAEGATRGTGLRLGALLHDCAKPETRKEEGDFVTFRGHDVAGAEKIKKLFRRLKASNRLADHVAGLARHHLILGFMVAERPLTRRQVFGYLTRTDPVPVDVTLLTVADRLAARGTSSIAGEEMVKGHLELASEMVADGLGWREQGPPAQFLPGDELAAELGIEPGPALGRVVRELAAARYAGEIHSASEAVETARRFLEAE